MNRARTFDTIWREQFDPELVQVPRVQYRDYVPLVNVSPQAVYDEDVIRIDDRFKKVLSTSFNIVNKFVAAVPPVGVTISMRQLIKQIPGILSGIERSLRVFARNRQIKVVPTEGDLKDACSRIQSVILERLLLFEDLPGVLTADEFDDWADAQRSSLQSSTHTFRRGEKLSSLLELLDRDSSEKAAIFVRNIPVCESVCRVLVEEGFTATFLHGEITDQRQQRLDDFRTGNTRVLVVTRQLFGRGFDLPQADKAIFYSPKQSSHVMWQEMLRIRSTARRAKTVFVLFYAWTAEHTKMMRLLRAMLGTGAKQVGGQFRWKYYEEEDRLEREAYEEEAPEQESTAQEPEEEEAQEPEFDEEESTYRQRTKESRDFKTATRNFVVNVIAHIDRFRKETAEEINGFLRQTAAEVGFSTAWPCELAEMLFLALGVTIVSLRTRKDVSRKNIKNELAKILHPDKHAEAVGVEKDFWHELSVNINL